MLYDSSAMEWERNSSGSVVSSRMCPQFVQDLRPRIKVYYHRGGCRSTRNQTGEDVMLTLLWGGETDRVSSYFSALDPSRFGRRRLRRFKIDESKVVINLCLLNFGYRIVDMTTPVGLCVICMEAPI